MSGNDAPVIISDSFVVKTTNKEALPHSIRAGEGLGRGTNGYLVLLEEGISRLFELKQVFKG